MAHALAIDEKRSKFTPILLCPPISDYSQTEEVWFPGAHADVGGGYQDADGLPGLSLNWMIDLLNEIYKFNEPLPRALEDPNGLAHWSYGDVPSVAAGECKDRTVPGNAVLHPSINVRKHSSQERIIVNDTPQCVIIQPGVREQIFVAMVEWPMFDGTNRLGDTKDLSATFPASVSCTLNAYIATTSNKALR